MYAMINSVQAVIIRNTNRRQLPARIAAVFGGNTKSKNTIIDVFRQPQPTTTTMIKTISTVSTNNYYQQRYSDISHAYKNYYSTSTSSLKEDSSKEVRVDHSSNDNNTQQVQSQQTPPLSSLSSSSPFGNTTKNNSKRRKKKRIIPRKAAVELTEKARIIFQKLLDNQPTKEGILLNYTQSATGEPRMVFSFSFVSKEELDDQDEGYVKLLLVE
jgi:hypothetical protein